jgi:hypothetical protein
MKSQMHESKSNNIKDSDIQSLKTDLINLINANNGKITINIPKNNSLSARTFKKYYYEDKTVVTQKLNHINTKIDKIIHHMDQHEQQEQHEQHEQSEQQEQSDGMTDAPN